jgi:hypothetical protein
MEFGWIRNVRIGHAARALCEHQYVIGERCIASDGQSGPTNLYPVAIDDNALTTLTEHDADWPAERSGRRSKVEQARRGSFRARSIQLSLAAGFVALFIAGMVRPARAQTNTFLGTGALGKNTTGTDNTALGFDALFENTVGIDNTAVGANTLGAIVGGAYNTAIGANALFANNGGGNTAIGWNALFSNQGAVANTATGFTALENSTGDENTATGSYALQQNTTGAHNTAVGSGALETNHTGSQNVAIGFNAGIFSSGNNNIDIGHAGVFGESNTIRIGTKGVQTRALIAGINSSPVYGSPVFVNGNGRLGIQASSARYKRDIRDMGDASAGLLRLRPVSFRYKQDPNGTLQYGLIAEELEQVYPEMVTYGEDGKPESVAYHLLPAMLLNEVQKLAKENQQKEVRITALQRQIVAQQNQIGALQKETARIDTLTARLSALEEQARTARPESLAAAMR